MAYNKNNPNGQATMANSAPVVIASDQSAVPVSAASLPLPTGAATETTLSALNTKVTAVNTGAVTISSALPAGANAIGSITNTSFAATQATASSLNAQVQGAGANGAAVTGNPVLIAGSDGTNARSLKTDTSGNATVYSPDLSAAISIAANATSSGQITTLQGAGTATIHITGTFVATVQVQVTGDGTNWVNVTGSQSVVNAATGVSLASGNITAVGVYQVDVAGMSGVRVITTAFTSGTVTGTVKATIGSGIVSVEGIVPIGGSLAGTNTQAVMIAPADAQAVQNGLYSTSASMVFNGTTWDRTRTANADAQAVTGLVGSGLMAFNGTNWDRVRAGFGDAGPATGILMSSPYLFNGSTNDRARGMGVATTTGDTGAKTATGNGATQTNVGNKGIQIVINMGAVTGTTPTCTLKVQGSVDATNFYDIPGATTAALTATGIYGITIYPGSAVTAGTTTTGTTATASGVIPRSWRMVWTIGGTTPSFTITSITYNYLPN